MKCRNIVMVLLFLVIGLSISATGVRADQCWGSGSETHDAYTCPYNRGYSCVPYPQIYTHGCSFQNGEGSSCSGCVFGGQTCQALTDGCNIYPSENGSGGCTEGAHLADNGCQKCTTVNGGWSTYGGWSGCSACSKTHTRTCTNPAPSCGGSDCVGQSSESTHCGTTNGGWGAWSDNCADQCGQPRSRSCNNPSPACGGSSCQKTDGSYGLSESGNCSSNDKGSPSIPNITDPVCSATPTTFNNPTTVTLSWAASDSRTDHYQIQVIRDADGAVVFDNTTSSTNISPTVSAWARGVYHWQVRAVNTTCGPENSNWSTQGCFRLNSPPALVSLTLKNNAGTIVPVEAGNRNQICQTAFGENRNVTFEAVIRDADGNGQLVSAVLWWNGVSYPMAIGAAVNGTDKLATVSVNYDNVSFTGTYPLSVIITDIYGANNSPGDAGRSWKVWNCQVSVSGNIYDSSAVASPNCSSDIGYNVAYTGGKFSSLTFFNVSNSVAMNPISGSSYNSGTNFLTWGRTYDNEFFNIGFDVLNPVLRIYDLAYGTSHKTCRPTSQLNLSDSNVVDPYTNANIAVQVDFAGAKVQDQWYQVIGGGVKAQNSVVDSVPVTCQFSGTCVSALTMDPVGVVLNSNGMVAAQSVTVSSTATCVACLYGRPNNWNDSGNQTSGSSNYSNFYNQVVVSGQYDQAKTYDTPKKLSEVVATMGTAKVVFVDGILEVDENITVANGSFLMVVAKDGITVDQSVTRMDGIWLTDGDITIDGANDNQLIVNGTMSSDAGDIHIHRDFIDRSRNNTTPAVVVNYRPDFLFSMPGVLSKILSGWKEGN